MRDRYNGRKQGYFVITRFVIMRDRYTVPRIDVTDSVMTRIRLDSL